MDLWHVFNGEMLPFCFMIRSKNLPTRENLVNLLTRHMQHLKHGANEEELMKQRST